MTPELQHRIDGSMRPFDGLCIHNNCALSLSQLHKLLIVANSILSVRYPEIWVFSDWHEHDGFIVDSKPKSWTSMNATLASNRSLFDSRDDDAEVRVAVYPPAFDWLLRYNIDQDDESDYNTALCDFDFSVADNLNLTELTDNLLTRFPNLLTQCDSQSWFKNNYGG